MAAPFADVDDDAVCDACASTLPDTPTAGPAAKRAVVCTVGSEIATTGTSTTSPPAAPPSTVVVIESVEVAERVRSRAPVTCAFAALEPEFSSPACVMSSTELIATEAPIPTVPPVPSSDAVAFAVLSTDDVADMETSAMDPVRVTVGGPRPETAWIRASVSTSTRFSASEPAMPTSPELPAPEVASASSLCVAPVPVVFIAASSTRPFCEVSVESAERLASFVIETRLIATAAPIVAVPPAAADPSAFAVPPVLAEVLKLARPCVETR